MIRVNSEVGRLERVLVHEPGREVDLMVPAMMEELLFDDILYGERAREEHRRIRSLLRLRGVEVVEARALLAESLERPEARAFAAAALAGAVSEAAGERLRGAGPPELATMLIEGIRRDHPAPSPGAEEPRNAADARNFFDLLPLCNWCFQRDPLVAMNGGVVIPAMATRARERETLLTRILFRFHPELAAVPVWLDLGDPGCGGREGAWLEGGDLLVLSAQVVVAGQSARTNRAGIEALAAALRRREEGPRWLLVVEIPRRRAYMHLDTVFTPVDSDAALVHAPVILPGGGEPARVSVMDLHAATPAFAPRGDLLGALREFGLDYEPIVCGGPDPLEQQREQWTDGANALALAPGVILLYKPNVGTVRELSRHGFEVVGSADLLLGRKDFPAPARRVCIQVSASEISRARGGPHCLAHPLARAG